jgi:hypothetical protein
LGHDFSKEEIAELDPPLKPRFVSHDEVQRERAGNVLAHPRPQIPVTPLLRYHEQVHVAVAVEIAAGIAAEKDDA